MRRETDEETIARYRAAQRARRARQIRRREQNAAGLRVVYLAWAVIAVIGLICLAAGIH